MHPGVKLQRPKLGWNSNALGTRSAISFFGILILLSLVLKKRKWHNAFKMFRKKKNMDNPGAGFTPGLNIWVFGSSSQVAKGLNKTSIQRTTSQDLPKPAPPSLNASTSYQHISFGYFRISCQAFQQHQHQPWWALSHQPTTPTPFVLWSFSWWWSFPHRSRPKACDLWCSMWVSNRWLLQLGSCQVIL